MEAPATDILQKKILESIPFGFVQIDMSGKIIYANQSVFRLLDISEESLIDTHYGDLEWEQINEQYEPLKPEEHTFFQAVMGNTVTGIIRGLKKGEEVKWLSVSASPFYDDEGNQTGAISNFVDITDKKELERTLDEQAEKIRKEEELLKQGILDALGDAILVVDSEGIVLNMNKSFSTYLANELYKGLKIGTSIYDFIDCFDESEFLENGMRSILAQEIKSFDHEVKLLDDKWYNLRATPLIDQFGAVISLQNINTRKEIEIALEKSLRKYRNIYNKAPVMMHSINRKLEIISVSDFWLENMGYERNEVIGRSPMDFIAGTSRDRIRKNLKTLFDAGEVKNAEYQYVKKSGEVMEVLLSAVAEYDENGKFERSIAGMIDITDQKMAERDLQESRMRLLESQRISKIGNYEFDVESGEFIPSSEMSMMMGFGKEHRDVSVIEELIHPDDLELFRKKLFNAIKKGTDFFHIYRVYHLVTKKLKWISGRGRMIKGARGKVIKMIGTVQDITEQRSAEDKIKRLSDRVLLATEIANLGVWEYNRENDEVFWEDQMYNIFTNFDHPATLDEIRQLFIEEDGDFLAMSRDRVRAGINFLEGEFRVRIDDEIKYLRSFIRVMRQESGKYKGLIGVVYDITEDKKLQLELESSLDEKNVLIKEVHHRVKNNMQLISSIMALKSYDLEDEASKSIFEDINNRIKAMAVIHDKLYTFYNVSEIDLSDYLFHIAQELQVLLGASTIQINVESEQIIMNVDKALLIGLVVSELVSNAIKHSFSRKEKGTVTIHFSKVNNKHHLSVLNDGGRIPKDALTKATGLGISLIKTFSKQLNGELDVDKRNGFTIIF